MLEWQARQKHEEDLTKSLEETGVVKKKPSSVLMVLNFGKCFGINLVILLRNSNLAIAKRK